MSGVDEKYLSIIEYSPVSLWAEDISMLRARLEKMHTGGAFNLRAYLAEHPEFVQEAASLIRVIDVNQASLRLFEADRKEQLIGPLDRALDEVSRSAITDTILAIDEGKSGMESESSARTLKGSRLSLIVKSHIPPAHAVYPYMLVSLVDITSRKKAEERERRAAFIMQSVIESTPDLIFIKDTERRTILCNQAFAGAIGKKPEDLYGKTDIENGWSVELVRGNPEKGIGGYEKDDAAALSGKTVHTSSEPVEVDKGIRYFDTVKVPLKDPDGAIVGLIGISRDVTERRQAEAELRKAKDFAENLIHTANVLVLCLDLEGRVTLMNEAAERVTGYRLQELEGLNWFKTVVPRDRYPDAWAKFERLCRDADADAGAFENPLLTKWGEERYIAWQNSQIREDGQATGTLSFGIDITDRRRSEEELAWERGLFTMLMDNLPDQIYFKDTSSRIVRASKSHARTLGLDDPSQEIGKRDADFFSEQHALKALEDEQQIARTGEPLVDVEERLTYPDRPDAWVLTTKMALRGPAGQVVGTFGISHDITERKLLEARNQQLAALVESADDAIVGMDMDRRITVWSRGAERIYGYSAEEMLGSRTSTLIPPDREEEARMMRERVIRGEQLTHYETVRVRKDGAKILVSLTLSAIRDAQGAIAGLASVARDVTEQKAMEAQLERFHRLESLATLAGGVAHQFNNINTVVKGYLGLLRGEKSLSDRLQSFVAAADVAVNRAVDITDRLLMMTEPTLDPSATVRLDELARSALTGLGKLLASEGVTLVHGLAETPPAAGEESRLRFVISSLLTNALDALLDRPTRVLTVRTGRRDNGAFLEVEDTGCGIPAANLPRIFSPFYSTKGEWAPHGSPQGRLKGLGLSLSISSATVSDFGGRIEVQSTEGTGSVFRILLLPAETARSVP